MGRQQAYYQEEEVLLVNDFSLKVGEAKILPQFLKLKVKDLLI